MDNKQKTQERRNAIRHFSQEMVDLGNLINNIIADVPHKRGVVYRSLKNRGNEYIVHVKNPNNNFSSMHIAYQTEDGKSYEIDFKQTGTIK